MTNANKKAGNRPSNRNNRPKGLVTGPAASGRVISSSNRRSPQVSSTRSGMSIRHIERILTVNGSTEFSLTQFSCNPGLDSSFPWLSAIATRFEKYKFRSLKFHYTPAAATAAGSVLLVFDFDPMDPAPASVIDAMTYHDFAQTPIWQYATLGCDLRSGDMLPQKNTRFAPIAFDLNNYDVGNLFVITSGCADTNPIGYVEVEYTVDFMIHQISGASPSGVDDSWTSNSVGSLHLDSDIQDVVGSASVIVGTPAVTNKSKDGNQTDIIHNWPSGLRANAWKFTKNWYGTLTGVITGEALTEPVELLTGTNSDLIGPSPIPALQQISSNLNGAATLLTKTFSVVAKSGDYLAPYLATISAVSKLTKVFWLFNELPEHIVGMIDGQDGVVDVEGGNGWVVV